MFFFLCVLSICSAVCFGSTIKVTFYSEIENKQRRAKYTDYVIHFIFRWSEKRALLLYHITASISDFKPWPFIMNLRKITWDSFIGCHNQIKSIAYASMNFLCLNKRWSMDQTNYLIFHTQNDATCNCVRNEKKKWSWASWFEDRCERSLEYVFFYDLVYINSHDSFASRSVTRKKNLLVKIQIFRFVFCFDAFSYIKKNLFRVNGQQL